MRIGGTVYVRLDGKLITVGEGELTYSTGGKKREAILSSSGVAGFTEKPLVPFVEFDALDDNIFDFEEIKKLTSVTVQADLSNGKTIALPNAWYAGEGEGDSSGKIKVRFEAKSGETL